jgi:hypothetical protein
LWEVAADRVLRVLSVTSELFERAEVVFGL